MLESLFNKVAVTSYDEHLRTPAYELTLGSDCFELNILPRVSFAFFL